MRGFLRKNRGGSACSATLWWLLWCPWGNRGGATQSATLWWLPRKGIIVCAGFERVYDVV